MALSLLSLAAELPGSPISYDRLDNSVPEFRLLTLQPALLFNDPVETRLGKSSLVAFKRDPPANLAEAQERENRFLQGTQSEYMALSYTWGDPTVTRPILVNGREVKVTANLESALRHIRMATREKVLWVDAVCINQKNETEKSAQVRMMPRIYEYAFQVIVWLGEERPRTTALATYLLDRHITYDYTKVPFIQDDLQKTIDVPMYEKVWDAFGQDLLKRLWWTRIWVVQEVACARRVEVVCGRHKMIWDSLVHADKFARDHDLHIYYTTNEELEQGEGFLPNSQWKNEYRIRRVSGRPIRLSELLINNLHCSATDPRDMIFALTSLATDVGDAPEMLADYAKDVRQVYIDVVKFHIRKYNSLDIISLSRLSKKQPDLPSWVPDWSNTRETITNPLPRLTFNPHEDYVYTYRASGDLKPISTFSASDSILLVSGTRLDTIARVGIPCPTGRQCDPAIWAWMPVAFGQPTDTADAGAHFSRPYVRGGSIIDAFNRTTCADRARNGLRSLPGQRGVDRRVGAMPPNYRPLQKLTTKEQQRFWEADAKQATALVCMRRRLFATQEGYLGLGPVEAQVGDVVCVLFGCSVPVIIRNTGSESGSRWKLVGESFVMGIMDGELIEDMKQAKVHEEKFELE